MTAKALPKKELKPLLPARVLIDAVLAWALGLAPSSRASSRERGRAIRAELAVVHHVADEDRRSTRCHVVPKAAINAAVMKICLVLIGPPPGCFREMRSSEHSINRARRRKSLTRRSVMRAICGGCKARRQRMQRKPGAGFARAADLAAWRRSHGIKSTSERIEWIDRPFELLIAVDRQIRGRYALALALDDRRGDRLEAGA